MKTSNHDIHVTLDAYADVFDSMNHSAISSCIEVEVSTMWYNREKGGLT